MYRNIDIKSINYLKDNFSIYWRVTSWCNYHCPYCINQNTRLKVANEYNEDLVYKISNALNSFLIKNNIHKVKLILSGGEVGFYDLTKILDNIKNVNEVTITTNFSAKVDNYKNLYKYCYEHNINLILILSLHEEHPNFVKDSISFTKWCRENNYKEPKISLLITNDFDFNIINEYKKANVKNLKLTRMKKLEAGSNSLVELSSEVEAKYEQLIKEYNKTNSPTYKVLFKDNTECKFTSISNFIGLLDEGGFIPNGYYCDSGSKKISVDSNGDVRFNRCAKYEDKCVGNILTDNIIIAKQPILCDVGKNSNKIHCGICSGISLYRKEEE